METIKDKNGRLCIEQNCSDKCTEYVKVDCTGGMVVHLYFCERHAKMYKAFYWLSRYPMTDGEYPDIICEKTKAGLQFYCEFCGELHKHSKGGGHRIAHCTNPKSPYFQNGYILKEVNK